MLQARPVPDSHFGFRSGFGLSGATPGNREELGNPSRERALRGCADLLTQGATRWSLSLPHKEPNSAFLNALARSLLAGEATVDAIAARMGRTLGIEARWIRTFARRYAAKFTQGDRPRRREVVEFLRADPGFQRAWRKPGEALRIGNWLAAPLEMLPAPAAADWNVPRIESEGELAEWLGLSVAELEWFADLKRLGAKRREEKLRHYSYRVLAKSTGGTRATAGGIRLIEAPKLRLKAMQRKILTEILAQIPSHPAAHGFVKGRSIKTFAAPHVGRCVVLRMDLREFFPSLRGGRVQALFRTAGYPERVADLLGGLCTNATPRDVWKAAPIDPAALYETRQLYAWPHLPQGAPTSPTLANLCAYRVDCRLSGLARTVGATYTRYADDLAFSGDEVFEQRVERFALHAAAILYDEGFEVHHRKTRIMRQGVRQYLAGVVANERVNVVRADFDRLKATLTNCAKHGPASQNREAHPAFRQHLVGRIAFVEMINPQKAARLKKIFDRIGWNESA
jgi:RNA-directed DNA polymerase